MDALYRLVTSLAVSLMSALGIQAPPATWQLHAMLDGRTVSLTFSDHPRSSHAATIPIDQFDGLKPLLQAAGPARFRLKRDAGVFEFDGVLRGGAGGGTMEFVPSETFPAELERRGFATPMRVEQMKMAWHDTGFAFIDELAAQNYQRPTLPQLVNAGDHGIDRIYLRELSRLGYRVGSIDALIRLRDHGVSPEWLRTIQARNAGELSIDELVSLRDHGVNTLEDLRRRGGS